MTAGNIPPKDPHEDAWQPDAESLNALEAEIPILAILRSFADEACRQPWFAESVSYTHLTLPTILLV